MLAGRAEDRSLTQGTTTKTKLKKSRFSELFSFVVFMNHSSKKLAVKYLKNFKQVEGNLRQSAKTCRAYTGDVVASAGDATFPKSSGCNCYPLRSNTVKMTILHTLRVVP